MKRITLKQKVIGLHLANPDWPSRRIANALHISQNRVTMYASKYGLGLPKAPKPPVVSDDEWLRRSREYLAGRGRAVQAYLGVVVPEAAE